MFRGNRGQFARLGCVVDFAEECLPGGVEAVVECFEEDRRVWRCDEGVREEGAGFCCV